MKMKKSTDDLMKILRSTPSVDEYFDQNDNEIFFGSLSELIDFYLARKKLTKADVVRNSGMNRHALLWVESHCRRSAAAYEKERLRASVCARYKGFYHHFQSGKSHRHRQYKY